MPHLYPHKTKGWRIIYRVSFLDGGHTDKTRWAKKKLKAQEILSDVGRLESFSRKNSLSREEAVYCLNKGYINEEEANRLVKQRVSAISSWDKLVKKYEDWSRTYCRKKTHAVNMYRLSNVLRFVNGKPPGEFIEDDVKNYIQARKKDGVRSATVRHEQVILRKLLDYLGGDNPARKVPLIKVTDEHIPRVFTRAELTAFMKILKNRRKHLRGYLRPAVLAYLYAGLRPSEIVRLTSHDIRVNKILVHGETKTGKSRSVEIHPRLAPHIRACIRKGGKYVFGGNAQLLPESIGLSIRRIISAAGLEGVTPYSFRHTFITGLLRAGADLRYVMDKAGHKKLSTTTRYLHVTESDDSPVRRIKF